MNDLITVRRPVPAELPAVAAAYTEANLHDPVLSWVVPDEDARRRLTAGDGRQMSVAYLGGFLESGELLIAEDEPGGVVGVSMWEKVDHTGGSGGSGMNSQEAVDFVNRAYGEHAGRMLWLLELTGRRKPDGESYWYLLNIVVEPARRGQGIGGAMLVDQLKRVDAAGMPAYLEASSPRNRRLYERVGFAAVGDPIDLPEGPSLQPMWRPAAQ